MRGTHDLETRQQLRSACFESRRKSTTWSSSSGGRSGFGLVVPGTNRFKTIPTNPKTGSATYQLKTKHAPNIEAKRGRRIVGRRIEREAGNIVDCGCESTDLLTDVRSLPLRISIERRMGSPFLPNPDAFGLISTTASSRTVRSLVSPGLLYSTVEAMPPPLSRRILQDRPTDRFVSRQPPPLPQ